MLAALILATGAASASGSLSLARAKQEVRSWLRVQARTGVVEGGSSVHAIRTAKCDRRSRSHVVCNGLIYWRNARYRKDPGYVCLFRGVSVRLGPGGFVVGQGLPESRCAGSLKTAESMAGFR